MDRSDISKFFDEETEKTQHFKFPSPLDPDFVERNKLESNLVHEILSRIKDNPEDSGKYFSKLIEFRANYKLSWDTVEKIFLRVNVDLMLLPQRKKAEIEAEFFKKNKILHADFLKKNKIPDNACVMDAKDRAELDERIKSFERSYRVTMIVLDLALRKMYENEVEKYIEGCDLPESLTQIDKYLDVVPPGAFYEIKRKVLLKKKAELERNLDLKIREIQRKKQIELEILDEDNLNGQAEKPLRETQNVNRQDNESQYKNETLAVHKNERKNHGYPPYYRKLIIDTAARLFEIRDKVLAVDIFTELGISKNTFFRQTRHFGLNMTMIRDEAQKMIREKEK